MPWRKECCSERQGISEQMGFSGGTYTSLSPLVQGSLMKYPTVWVVEGWAAGHMVDPRDGMPGGSGRTPYSSSLPCVLCDNEAKNIKKHLLECLKCIN